MFKYNGIDYNDLSKYDELTLLREKDRLSYEALYSDIVNELYHRIVSELRSRGWEG